MASDENYDLFISYKRNEGNGASNKKRADRIASILERHFGFKCFLDQREVRKTDYQSQLRDSIKRCRAFIYLATEASLDFGSENNFAALEWHWAVQEKKEIFYCWVDTQKEPKMLDKALFFDWTDVGKNDDDHTTLSDDHFQRALFAFGDSILPLGVKDRDGYRALSVIKCREDEYDRASALLEWANRYHAYPNTSKVIQEARTLIQKKFDQIKSREDFAFAQQTEKDKAYASLLQERNDLLAKVHEAEEFKRGIERIGGDVRKIDLNVSNMRQVAENRTEKLVQELANARPFYEVIHARFPGKSAKQVDQELQTLIQERQELSVKSSEILTLQSELDKIKETVNQNANHANDNARSLERRASSLSRQLSWARGIAILSLAAFVLGLVDRAMETGIIDMAIANLRHVIESKFSGIPRAAELNPGS